MTTSIEPTRASRNGSANGAALSQSPVDLHTPPVAFESVPSPKMSVGFVPTPTIEYRTRRKQIRAVVNSARPVDGRAIAVVAATAPKGPRVLMYKQDPSVAEIGVRKAYLPDVAVSGPRDARIEVQGVAPVALNALGDLIGPTPGTEGFDAVHTFAVVRQTLTMYQRALRGVLPWQWNAPDNAEPIAVFPRAGETPNAFYSRSERALKFFFFTPPGAPAGTPPVFTCRSLDIVAHETGHAVLDALKPDWLLAGNSPETGGLHESFGDLTAIFLALAQLDQCEAFIAQTKGDLHAKTFLSDLAEQFGLALGRPNGLRNADNDFKLSEVGTEVHAISQVFTGGVYDVLADMFALERDARREDEAATLHRVAARLCSLVVRAIERSPDRNVRYVDVVNAMLAVSSADGAPETHRDAIREQFALREVVSLGGGSSLALGPGYVGRHGAQADLQGCCGTMRHPDYDAALDAALREQRAEVAACFGDGRRR